MKFLTKIIAFLMAFVVSFSMSFSVDNEGMSLRANIKTVYAADDSTDDDIDFNVIFKYDALTFGTSYTAKTGSSDAIYFTVGNRSSTKTLENGKITISNVQTPVDFNLTTIDTTTPGTIIKNAVTKVVDGVTTGEINLNDVGNVTQQYTIGFKHKDPDTTNTATNWFEDSIYLHNDVTFVLTGALDDGTIVQKTQTVSLDFTGTMYMQNHLPTIQIKFMDLTNKVYRTRQTFYANMGGGNTVNTARLGLNTYEMKISLPKIEGRYPEPMDAENWPLTIRYAYARQDSTKMDITTNEDITAYDASTGILTVQVKPKLPGKGIPTRYRASTNEAFAFHLVVDANYYSGNNGEDELDFYNAYMQSKAIDDAKPPASKMRYIINNESTATPFAEGVTQSVQGVYIRNNVHQTPVTILPGESMTVPYADNTPTALYYMYVDTLPIDFSDSGSTRVIRQALWSNNTDVFRMYHHTYVNVDNLFDSIASEVVGLKINEFSSNTSGATLRDLSPEEYNIESVYILTDKGPNYFPFNADGGLGNDPDAFVNLYYIDDNGQKVLLKTFTPDNTTDASLASRTWDNTADLPIKRIRWETSKAYRDGLGTKSAIAMMITYRLTPDYMNRVKNIYGLTEEQFCEDSFNSKVQYKNGLHNIFEVMNHEYTLKDDLKYSTRYSRKSGYISYPITASLSSYLEFYNATIGASANPSARPPIPAEYSVRSASQFNNVGIKLSLPVVNTPAYFDNPTFYIPLPDTVILGSATLDTRPPDAYEGATLSVYDVTDETGTKTTKGLKVEIPEKYYHTSPQNNNGARKFNIYIKTTMKTSNTATAGEVSSRLYAYATSFDKYYASTTNADPWDVDGDGKRTPADGTRIFRSTDANTSFISVVGSASMTVDMFTRYNGIDTFPTALQEIPQTNVNGENQYQYVVRIKNRIVGFWGSKMKILVRLPFSGNTDLSDDTTSLDTDITPQLSNLITPPDGFKVYYTTNEKPTNNITTLANGWTDTVDPSDLPDIKNLLFVSHGTGEAGTKYLKTDETIDFPIDVFVQVGTTMNTLAYAQTFFDYTSNGLQNGNVDPPILTSSQDLQSYSLPSGIRVPRVTSTTVKVAVNDLQGNPMKTVPDYTRFSVLIKYLDAVPNTTNNYLTLPYDETNDTTKAATSVKKFDLPEGTYQIVVPVATDIEWLDFKDHKFMFDDGTNPPVDIGDSNLGANRYKFQITSTNAHPVITISKTYIPDPAPSLAKPTVTFTDNTLVIPNNLNKYDTPNVNSTVITVDNIGNDSTVTDIENVVYSVDNNNGLQIDKIDFPAQPTAPSGTTVSIKPYDQAGVLIASHVLDKVPIDQLSSIILPNYGDTESRYVAKIAFEFYNATTSPVDAFPKGIIFNGIKLTVHAKNRNTINNFADRQYTVKITPTGKYQDKMNTTQNIVDNGFSTTTNYSVKGVVGIVNEMFYDNDKSVNIASKPTVIRRKAAYDAITGLNPPAIVGYKYKNTVTNPVSIPDIDGTTKVFDTQTYSGYYTNTTYDVIHRYNPVYPINVKVYCDKDADGLFNIGDTLIEGATVKLALVSDPDTTLFTANTLATGVVSFPNLEEDNYIVTVINNNIVDYKVFGSSTDTEQAFNITLNDAAYNKDVRLEWVPNPAPALANVSATISDLNIVNPNSLNIYKNGNKNSTNVTLNSFGNAGNVKFSDVKYTFAFDDVTEMRKIIWPAKATADEDATVSISIKDSDGDEYGPFDISIKDGGTLTLASVTGLSGKLIDKVFMSFDSLLPSETFSGVVMEVAAIKKITADTISVIAASATAKSAVKGSDIATVVTTTPVNLINVLVKPVVGKVSVVQKSGNTNIGTPISDVTGLAYEDFSASAPAIISGYTYKDTTHPTNALAGHYDEETFSGKFNEGNMVITHNYTQNHDIKIIVFADKNGNSTYNAGIDSLVQGAEVYLYKDGQTIDDAIEVITNENGEALFGNYSQGNYKYKVINTDIVNYMYDTEVTYPVSITLGDATSVYYSGLVWIPDSQPSMGEVEITKTSDTIVVPNKLNRPVNGIPTSTLLTFDNLSNSGNTAILDAKYTYTFDGKTSPNSVVWTADAIDKSGNSVTITVRKNDDTILKKVNVDTNKALTIDLTQFGLSEGEFVAEIEVLISKLAIGKTYNGLKMQVSAKESSDTDRVSTININSSGHYYEKGSMTQLAELNNALKQTTINVKGNVKGTVIVKYVSKSVVNGVNTVTEIAPNKTFTGNVYSSFTGFSPEDITEFNYNKTDITVAPVSEQSLVSFNKVNYSGYFINGTVTLTHEYVTTKTDVLVKFYNSTVSDENLVYSLIINRVDESSDYDYDISNMPEFKGFDYDSSNVNNKLTSYKTDVPREIIVMLKDNRYKVTEYIVKGDEAPYLHETYFVNPGDNFNNMAPEITDYELKEVVISNADNNDTHVLPLNRIISVNNVNSDTTINVYYKKRSVESFKNLTIRYVDSDTENTIYEYQLYNLKTGFPYHHIIQDLTSMGYHYKSSNVIVNNGVASIMISSTDENVITLNFERAKAKVKVIHAKTDGGIIEEDEVEASVMDYYYPQEKTFEGYVCVSTAKPLLVSDIETENIVRIEYMLVPIDTFDPSGNGAVVVRHVFSEQIATSDGTANYKRILRSEVVSASEALNYDHMDFDVTEATVKYLKSLSDVVRQLESYGYVLQNTDDLTVYVNIEGNVIDIIYEAKLTDVTVHYYKEGTTEQIAEDITDNTQRVGSIYNPHVVQKAGFVLATAVKPIELSGSEPNEITLFYKPLELSAKAIYINSTDGEVLEEHVLDNMSLVNGENNTDSSFNLGSYYEYTAPRTLNISRKNYQLTSSEKQGLTISEVNSENVITFTYKIKKAPGNPDNTGDKDDNTYVYWPEEETDNNGSESSRLVEIDAIKETEININKEVETIETPYEEVPYRNNNNKVNSERNQKFYNKFDINFIGPKLNIDEHIQYVQGYKDGSFKPSGNITRAEIAMIFYNLIVDSDKDKKIDSKYSDVANDEWYSAPINYLSEKKVLTGFADGTFRPDQPLTRAEFSNIVYQFVSQKSADMSFSDVPAKHWAVNYINSAHANNIMLGYTDNTFRPDASISRAETVVTVNRMIGRYYNQEEVLKYANKYTDLNVSDFGYGDIIEATIKHDHIITDENLENWVDSTI